MRIAFAESATAGRLASEFALVKDSGKILLGGIVCYDVGVKCDLLNIPKLFIEKYTPESAEVTKALAENLRPHFKADIIVAVTGLASPGGSENAVKPVGTMFIHILMPEAYIAHREVFDGSPEEIILQTIDTVCLLILDKLDSQTPLRVTA
jgi:nicotinamide-nucleotide amidase